MTTMESFAARDVLWVNEIGVAVMVIDREGVIRYVNRQVSTDLKQNAERIVGKNYRQVFSPGFVSFYDRLVPEYERSLKRIGTYFWEEPLVWEQVSVSAVLWESMPCLAVTITNISEVACSEFQLETVAYYDHILKLPNGALLEEDMNAISGTETVALLYLEPRNYQDINELYGWDKGNDLLRQIRDWLLVSESRSARLYRVNNGFALLGRRATMEDACSRAREIQRRFKSPWPVVAGGNNLLVYLSVNIGIVYGKYARNEMRNLLMRTIRAAEHDKGGFAVYDEEEDRRTKKAVEIRDSLIGCVFNDMKGFEIHYQPIVDAASRRWVAVEALCRWTTPGGEQVPPVVFIRMAEQLNLIDQLDAWMRHTAMRQCASLGLGELDFTLDVNFSPTQRIDGEFVDAVIRSVEEARFPAGKLNIEITESAKMVFDKENIDGLMRLKEHGIGLSLDDFGTGHSSMENLMKISVNAIKTEKLFMEGIESDPSRQYFLKMMVDLAHHHGLRLIAEGVEKEDEFELAKQYGVDRVQGYLFSRPLPFEQLKMKVCCFRR